MYCRLFSLNTNLQLMMFIRLLSENKNDICAHQSVCSLVSHIYVIISSCFMKNMVGINS